jgi:hypothetical protein
MSLFARFINICGRSFKTTNKGSLEQVYVWVTQENLIGITLSKYNWLISIWMNLCLSTPLLVLLVITKRMQPTWMTSRVSALLSLKNLIVITQVGWNAINIHNSKDCLLTLYCLFSHFGNNRAASMGIKRASAHRKNPHPFFKLSTWIHHHLFILYCCGIYVFC